jgi:hypothetical protein
MTLCFCFSYERSPLAVSNEAFEDLSKQNAKKKENIYDESKKFQDA